MTISSETLAQYTALTSNVGMADLTGRTLIEVTGGDRTQFLHSFTTNDVKKLAEGNACESFVTSPQGKTLGHVILFNRGDALVLDTTPGQAAALITHFERYIISEDVTLRDVTAEQGVLLLAGPKATEVLPRLAGARVLVKSIQFVAPLNYFLQASRTDLPALLGNCEQAGAVRCGTEAVEMARLEAGTPLFGQDITDDNLPQEIVRDAIAISFTKGCYLGQETVARIDALGHVNRQLTGLRLVGTAVPLPGTQLSASDKVVGHITSAAWSPKLNAPLAIGLVRRAQAKPGTTLTSDHGDAVVVALPV